jgi:hypothetical protein
MIDPTNASIDAVLDALDAEPDCGSPAACIGITEPDDGSNAPPAIMADTSEPEPDTTDDTDLVETIPACIIATRQAPTRLEAT